MTLQTASQFTFTAGELSPKLHDRPDLKKYAHGARTVLNAITERHGGVRRRDGFLYVGTLPDGAIGRLVAFQRSSGVNLIIEILANQFLFYKEDGTPLEVSAGVPVTVATPWSESEIDGLRFAQSGDVVYITHPNYALRKMSRVTDTSFVLENAVITGGPFLSEQTDETHRIQASTGTGSITLTATKDTFQQGHEGSLWKLRWEDRSQYKKWQSNNGYFADDLIISRGKAYRQADGGDAIAGANAPDHTEGTEKDGHGTTAASATWEYLHSGFGVVRIDNYISATQVTATLVVGNELPEDIVRVGTKYWSEAAWSDVAGYPSVVTFYNDRLALARNNEVYMSQNGEFENMAPTDEHGDVVATAGLRFVLSDDQANGVRWLRQVQDVLIIGTTGSEWAMGPQSSNQAFGPDNVLAAPQSYHGSADFVQPQRINEALLFVNRTKRRLYEMTAQEVTTRYESAELSILSEHMMKNGLTESVYTESPEGIAWFLTSTGSLVAVTYERGQEIVGWHRHEVGGDDAFIESIAGITSEDETHDVLWMIVARTINGQTVRTIERSAAPFEATDDIATSGVFLDSALVFSGGPAKSARLAHLPNTTVDCVADGRVILGLQTDANGDVVLPFEASRCVFGLGYRTRLKTLRPDTQSQIGSSLGKSQAAPTVYVKFENTNLCEYGRKENELDTLVFATTTQTTDAAVALFTGIKEITIGADYAEDIALWFEQTQPLPMTIRAISWDAHVANR